MLMSSAGYDWGAGRGWRLARKRDEPVATEATAGSVTVSALPHQRVALDMDVVGVRSMWLEPRGIVS